jgi:hypothetical protein
MTPLFFSKGDLDSAVRSAYDRRERKRMEAAEEGVRRARADFDKVRAGDQGSGSEVPRRLSTIHYLHLRLLYFFLLPHALYGVF